MSLRMSVELGDGTVEQLAVRETGPVRIGRDPSCHVVLPSPDVSRRHLTIERGPGGYRITDASANGTMIGDQLVHQATIEAPGGLPLRVGPYVIRLEVVAPVAPVTAPPPPGRPRSAAPPPPARGAPPPASPRPPPAAPPVPSLPLPSTPMPSMPMPSMPMSGVPMPSMPMSGVPVTAAPRPAAPPAAALPAASPGPFAAPPDARELEPSRPLGDYDISGTQDVPVIVRKRIHRMLLDHLDLANLDRSKMDDQVAMRPKVRQALRRIVKDIGHDLPPSTDLAALIDEITDEALGLGPLERLLADDSVSEIMVVDPVTIYVERHGRLSKTALRFTDDEAVRAVIERIVTPLGRRIDESTPLVDARLKDGSRVNAVIRPLAIRGSCITIRKFAKKPLRIEDLIKFGSMSEGMAKFIMRAVKARKNIIISGGTGSGKTTLLNVLSGQIPEEERVVTVEDAAELQLVQPHVVSLESRPANMEGRGEYTIRDLVKNALRMRPDRIIVGECRGGEALDMLQAMNTGHEGSMTTTHANSPGEAVGRIETLALMAGLDLPSRAIREQIAQSIDVILQQTRFSDGSRRVTSIAEVVGLDDDGEVELHEIFAFHRTGTGPEGEVLGEYRASGYLPSFLDEFIAQGLVADGDYL
jgi:pilus assembly protein CpaF